MPPIAPRFCFQCNRLTEFFVGRRSELDAIKHCHPETALNIAFIKRSSGELVSSRAKVFGRNGISHDCDFLGLAIRINQATMT
jgi:hypothetical protein